MVVQWVVWLFHLPYVCCVWWCCSFLVCHALLGLSILGSHLCHYVTKMEGERGSWFASKEEETSKPGISRVGFSNAHEAPTWKWQTLKVKMHCDVIFWWVIVAALATVEGSQARVGCSCVCVLLCSPSRRMQLLCGVLLCRESCVFSGCFWYGKELSSVWVGNENETKERED